MNLTEIYKDSISNRLSIPAERFYYDSYLGKFMAYTDGAWKAIAPSEVISVQTTYLDHPGIEMTTQRARVREGGYLEFID